jgi:hypothetical protein
MQSFSLHSPVHVELVFPKKKSRFLSRGLSDFNLALDLGFLTKARNNTFFKPQFIFYAIISLRRLGLVGISQSTEI